MIPHLPFTFLLAALTAGASSLPGRRPAPERIYHAIYLFIASLLAVIGVSWLMYFIHR
jgi:hypothetical protein